MANLLFNSPCLKSPLSAEHQRFRYSVWGEEPGGRTSPLCQVGPKQPVTGCINCRGQSSTWNSSPSSSSCLTPSPSFFNGKTHFFRNVCLSPLSSAPGCPVQVPVLPLLLFIFLATLYSTWDLSSSIRDQTRAPCTGSMGVLTTGPQGESPLPLLTLRRQVTFKGSTQIAYLLLTTNVLCFPFYR